MRPGNYDILAYRDRTLSRTFTWKDSAGVAVNLAGYSARMHVRNSPTATTSLLSLDDEFTLGGAAGTISFTISNIILPIGEYVYDLEITSPSGTKDTLLKGKFIVQPSVTRT